MGKKWTPNIARARIREILKDEPGSVHPVDIIKRMPTCPKSLVYTGLRFLESKREIIMEGRRVNEYTYKWNRAGDENRFISNVWRYKEPLFNEPRWHLGVKNGVL